MIWTNNSVEHHKYESMTFGVFNKFNLFTSLVYHILPNKNSPLQATLVRTSYYLLQFLQNLWYQFFEILSISEALSQSKCKLLATGCTYSEKLYFCIVLNDLMCINKGITADI